MQSEKRKRSKPGEQRAKVFSRRKEVLDGVKDGKSLPQIQKELGMTDIPHMTFYENVERLKHIYHEYMKAP